MQGSVLDLLLFLIYIHDLPNGSLSEGCFVSLYADDLLLYKIIYFLPRQLHFFAVGHKLSS